MTKPFLAATLAAVGLAMAAGPAVARDGVKAGLLTCDVSAGIGMIIGSSKAVDCTFKGENGRVEHYSGRLGKLGLDVGATGEASMAWAVFASGEVRKAALAGKYVGASAQATVIAGLGANVLVGGFEDSINLQPLSIQGQTGLNVAAGLTSLTLEAAR